MTQIVALPDGRSVEFPDGMSVEDMNREIFKAFPQWAPQEAEQPKGFLKTVMDAAMPATGLSPEASKFAGEQLQSNVVKPIGDYMSRKPLVDPKTNQPYPEISSRLPTEAVPGAVDFITGIAKPSTRKIGDKPRGMDMLTEGLTGALVPDEKHRAEIYKNARKVTIDGVDSYIVTKDGKDYVINQPGFSPQDLIDVAAPAVTTSLAAAGPAAIAASTFGRSALTGLGLGAYSLGEDALSSGLGSSQEISPKKAAINAALGFGTQFAADKFGKIIRGVSDQTDSLTSAALARLEKAGIDPSTITPKMYASLNKNLPAANDVQAAVRLARFESFKVQPLGSNISRRGDVMSAENTAHLNDDNALARSVSLLKSDIQPAQVKRAAQDLVQGTTGRTVSPDVPLGIPTAQKELADNAGKSARWVKREYNHARALNASLNDKSAVNILEEVGTAFKPFANTTDKAQAVYKELFDLVNGRVGSTPISLNLLNDWRVNLSALHARGGADREAANAMRAAFDKALGNVNSFQYVKGGPVAAQQWQKATQTAEKNFTQYKADDAVSAVIEKTKNFGPNGKTYDLTLSPQQAADALLGTGFGSKQAAHNLGKAKFLLGPNSESWKEIRGEVLSRMIGSTGVASDAKISGTALKNSIQQIEASNPALRDVLFTKSEWTQFKQYAQMLDDLKPALGTNPTSPTATLNKFLEKTQGWPRGIKKAVDMVTPDPKNKLYKEALNPRIAQTQPAPLGVFPGMTVPMVNDKRYDGAIKPYRGLLNLFE